MQIDLFSQTGAELRDEGMQQAVDHADEVNDAWSEKAYKCLLYYVMNHPEPFMTEDVRKASEPYIKAPPSGRAWGPIMVRAAKAGIIKKVGFQSVSNPKAHCTPATLWVANC